jgi:hypothetical protein
MEERINPTALVADLIGGCSLKRSTGFQRGRSGFSTLLTVIVGWTSLLNLGDSALAKSMTFAVISGKPTRVHAYHSWDPSTCKSNSAKMTVVSRPAHGILIPHVVDHVITNSRFGPVGHCHGKPIRALQIDYKSEAGYRGNDSFIIDVTFGFEGRRDIDTYTVTVE